MSNVNVGSFAPSARLLKTASIAFLVILALGLLALNAGSVLAANWTLPKEIPGTNLAADDISTAVESGGKQWVVWKDSPGANYQIWYSSRPANGNWASAKILGATSNNQYFPSVGITADDQKLVAWQQLSNVHRINYVQFANSPGASSQLPGTGAAEYHPAVATSSAGKRFIVFSRAGTLYLAESNNGNNWTVDNISGASPNAYYPDVAVDDSTGLVHVAWWTDSGAINYIQRNVSGGSWKNQKNLGAGKNVNIAARGGKAVVSWSDKSAGYRIALRTLKNNNWGGVERPSQFGGGFRPHAVIDSEGNPHIIWMQNIDDANYDIYYSDYSKGNWASGKPLRASGGFNEGNDLTIDSGDGLHAVFLEITDHKTAFSSDRAGSPVNPTVTPTGPTKTPTVPGPGVTRYNDDNAAINYRETWLYDDTNPNPINGDYHATQQNGARANFNFVGSAVKIYYLKSKNYGKADIVIDNQTVDTIDMYASSLTYRVSKKYSGLSFEKHELKIINSGKKNPSSSGFYITLDAIDVTVPSMTATPTGTITNTPTETFTPTQTATSGPTMTPTATNTTNPNQTPSVTPTATQTLTNTLTPTVSPTPSNTPTVTNTPPPAVKTNYDDRSPLITFNGKWTLKRNDPPCLYKGTYKYAAPKAKNNLSLTFSGTQVRYWFVTGTEMGKVEVVIDGEVKGIATLKKNETKCAAWTSGILAAGEHTLELRPKTNKGLINIDVIVAFP